MSAPDSSETQPVQPSPGEASTPAALTPLELVRWAWRQLTSMRTALILLFLLAAVPGSVIPQTSVDAFAVSRWQAQHPGLTPIYQKLGLFNVYRSAWFSAIYLLLMASLVGCVLPRLRAYWRAIRARPPRTPPQPVPVARLSDHAHRPATGGGTRGCGSRTPPPPIPD